MPPSLTPDVSVLIACYDAGAYLEPAVRSALAQTLVDIEVIVVDDGSTDDSVAVVERLQREDARVRLVRMASNGGPAAARNRAIAEARGRWLAILDSDDLIAPDRLGTLVATAEASGADMIADDLLVFADGDPDRATHFLDRRSRLSGAFEVDLETYLGRTVMYRNAANLGFLKPLIRRDRMDALGIRYDERLRIAEDDDLVARLLLGGMRYRVMPQAGYFYRKHDHSISHRLNVRALDAMLVANAMLAAQIGAKRPAATRACADRHRSFLRARAFEEMIAALKSHRMGAAISIGLRNPTLLPLLRMPIAGLVRRLRPARPSPVPDRAQDELAILLERRASLRP